MTIPEINVPVINKMISAIKEKPEKFDMTTIFRFHEHVDKDNFQAATSEEALECGSACCFIGWANVVELTPERSANLTLRNSQAARTKMGLSFNIAEQLFYDLGHKKIYVEWQKLGLLKEDSIKITVEEGIHLLELLADGELPFYWEGGRDSELRLRDRLHSSEDFFFTHAQARAWNKYFPQVHNVLTQTARQLEVEDDDNFNMTTWGNHSDNEHSCGTVGCIAGHMYDIFRPEDSEKLTPNERQFPECIQSIMGLPSYNTLDVNYKMNETRKAWKDIFSMFVAAGPCWHAYYHQAPPIHQEQMKVTTNYDPNSFNIQIASVTREVAADFLRFLASGKYPFDFSEWDNHHEAAAQPLFEQRS